MNRTPATGSLCTPRPAAPVPAGLSPGHARMSDSSSQRPVPMPLRLYNSLTRQVEPFAPLDPACPTLYV